jgi:nickel-dependent lactate racemase
VGEHTPTLISQVTAPASELLSETVIRATLESALGTRYTNARLLVLIPDHTRSIPLPQLFAMLTDILRSAKQLDFMVALGTHPPLSEEALCKLVGITAVQRRDDYGHIGLLNHAWDDPNALTKSLASAAAQSTCSPAFPAPK